MGVSSFTKAPLAGLFFARAADVNHVRRRLILGREWALVCRRRAGERAFGANGMDRFVGCRSIAAGLLFSLLGIPAALAADCKPDALGTGRTIAVDPTEHGRIGTMQYEETLPLRDH